ncbi:MAG: HIT domain-containing protein, partial [Gammaproteobacteria bacterium]|nr:HIT domain-containing protein [Gammaproteobacteria bacterium]
QEKVSDTIQNNLPFDKMNFAALGNQVPQLHIHVIGRRKTDEAWPNPVWGYGKPIPYDTADVSIVIQSLKRQLAISIS